LDEDRKTPNARRAVELVFQQREAQQWTDAEATLFDSQFLLAKCAAGMAPDLDADYQVLLQEAPEDSPLQREVLDLIHGALRLSLPVVAQSPAQFASQIVGRSLALKDRPGMAVFVEEITAAAPRPWLRPLHPCFEAPGGALQRTLRGHSAPVGAVAVTGDGKRAVSASGDSLKVWDLKSGHPLRTLEGHTHAVLGVAVTGDGRLAVSASADNTLKVWDVESGRALCTLRGHSGPVGGRSGHGRREAGGLCVRRQDVEGVGPGEGFEAL
jgi:WD40 repeat protein